MKPRALVVVLLLASILTLVDASPASALPAPNWSILESVLETGIDVELTSDVVATVGASLDIAAGDDVVLDLNGYHLTIDSPTDSQAAISVPDGASLTISDSSATGTGRLTARGGTFAAGIGSDEEGTIGTITIDGGTIDTSGGIFGAGIGGGNEGTAPAITISGGTIVATGGEFGAGIGGGEGGNLAPIVISGGTITASAGMFGAGIGGGDGGTAPAITISGGTIVATAGMYGAGIGGPDGGVGGVTTITGGSVTATGGTAHGAGIGTGAFGGSGGTLLIEGVATTSSAVNGAPTPSSPAASIVSTAGAPGRAYHATATSGVAPARFTVHFGWLVTFDAAGGTPTPDTQAAAPSADEPAAPTRAGHTFAGWNGPTGPWDFTDPVTGALTLTAQWAPILHTVTFDSTGGTAVPGATVAEGAPVPEPAAPTRDGYTFTGWHGPSGPWDFTDPVTGALTLTAQWDLIAVSIAGESIEGGSITVAVDGLVPNAGYQIRVVGTDTAASSRLTASASAGTTVAAADVTADGVGNAVATLALPAGSAGGASIQIVDATASVVATAPLSIAAAPAQPAPTPPPAAPAPQPAPAPTQATSTQAVPSQTAALATTGTSTAITVTVAGILLGLGAALVFAGRRATRRTT